VDSCFPSESLHPLFIVEPLSRPLLIHNNNRDRFMTPEFPARSSPDFLLSLTASETIPTSSFLINATSVLRASSCYSGREKFRD